MASLFQIEVCQRCGLNYSEVSKMTTLWVKGPLGEFSPGLFTSRVQLDGPVGLSSPGRFLRRH